MSDDKPSRKKTADVVSLSTKIDADIGKQLESGPNGKTSSVLQSDEFAPEVLAYINKLMPPESDLVNEARDEEHPQKFIQQLRLIEMPFKQLQAAICHALKARIARFRWSRIGIDDQIVDDYLNSIEQAYHDAEMLGVSKADDSEEKKCEAGRKLFIDSVQFAAKQTLNGELPKDSSIPRGILHQFANGDREVGWHPDWKERVFP